MGGAILGRIDYLCESNSLTPSLIGTTSDIVQVRNLSYEYPGIRALDDVSFTVPRASVTALVGPNGAGKTTLLRCMAALDQPLDGSIWVDGIDVLEHPRACHRRIGYLSDFFGLYAALTVRQCLTYAALSQGVAAEAAASAVQQTAERLNLSAKLDALSSDLSRGQRQRVAIGQALIHGPSLLILDEPASGLDPQARHELAALFTQLRESGMTLIVSSHILAELDEYSTHMLVIRAGRLVESRALQVDAPASGRVQVRAAWAQAVEASAVAAVVASVAGVELVHVGTDDALFAMPSDLAVRVALLQALVGAGLPVTAFSDARENLHQSYLRTMQSDATSGARS